jgi:putative nucleotidyltransferase with HDIG domain
MRRRIINSLRTFDDEILKCLPEINKIEKEELRNKVVEAWALSLSESEFESIDDIPGTALPGTPRLKKGTQSDHLRGVGYIAQGIVDGLEKIHGDLGIDRDVLWACALCHDVGKPYEYSPTNRKRWKADISKTGLPPVRHPAYGVYIALTVGLPEEVVHVISAHSGEGELIKRSLINLVVHFADYAYWDVLESANYLLLD